MVEDEPNLGQTLQDYLRDKGYTVLWAQNVTSAFETFITYSPLIVLMDIGLPDGDGLTLAKRLRAIRKDFYLIFLSAQNDPETRVQGLEIGGEDYITKPFALKELTLRLQRILKVSEKVNDLPSIIRHGDLVIKFNDYELIDYSGNVITISQKERGILHLLYQKKNQAVSRDQIIEEIWGEGAYPSNRTVDNYIVKLRRWMDTDLNKPLDIKSIRGLGYKLVISKNKSEEMHGTI
ncbi:MAG: response regulator transcription factor [Bdellovibrionales bacterium]|nr:response regulator transcription factor [Bdellovibrionales bacterium]